MRGRPFAKGNSGKPKGARNKKTVMLEALLDGDAEKIVRKAMAMAIDGDPTAMKLCFERTLGTRRDRPVSFELPPIETAIDGAKALAAIIAAVASGEITPSEGAQISQLVTAAINALEKADFEQRLEKLEVASDPLAVPDEPRETAADMFRKNAKDELELKRQERRERQAKQNKPG